MLYELSKKASIEVSKYSNTYEIFIEHSKELELNADKTELNFAKEEIKLGIGIGVIEDKKLGYAYTSNINEIEKTAKQAYLNSKINEKDENFEFACNSKFKKIKNIYDKRIDDVTLDYGREYLSRMFDIAEEEKCNVSSAQFATGIGERLIVNSNGLEVYDKSTVFGGYIAVNAEKDGEISNGYEGESKCLYDLNPEKIAKYSCKLAKDSIGGKNIETGDTPIILDYHASSGLLNTFLNGINGDNVLRGRSVLKDKIGEKISSDTLTVYDDNSYEGGLASASCDSEGTPSQKTNIIEKGVLKGFIYNIYNANKVGCESTSNGFRGSYAGIPGVSASNIIFEFKDMNEISEIDKGIIVNNVLGAHTANPITGDFSVEISNGFLIEKGEIKSPIKKAMISGNIYEGLKNCRGIKSEIKQYGNFIIPQILIENIRVIGN